MRDISLDDRTQNAAASEEIGHLELLTQIWRRILQTDEVTPESNFFDLGGDSLLALTLFLEIERATGRHLPITAIYDAQTIAEQARLIAADSTPEFSPLVLLKPGNGGAPLFIFHGIGGTVVEFADLGKRLDTGGEVYAVQAQGVDGAKPPLDSVDDMATLYCDAIREKQPTGPYWLCGYSFGGLIAMEVARRLKHAGEDIGLLFLIDAYAHPVTWPLKSLLKVRLRKAVGKLLARLRVPLRENIGAVTAYVKRASSQTRNGSAVATPGEGGLRKREWLLKTRPDLPLPLLQTRLKADAALYRYRPAYYPGSAVFLKAHSPDPDFPDDPKYVWRRLIADLRVQVAPGSHLTIVSEHAAGVAARIDDCIREARGDSATESSQSAAVTPPSFSLARAI